MAGGGGKGGGTVPGFIPVWIPVPVDFGAGWMVGAVICGAVTAGISITGGGVCRFAPAPGDCDVTGTSSIGVAWADADDVEPATFRSIDLVFTVGGEIEGGTEVAPSLILVSSAGGNWLNEPWLCKEPGAEGMAGGGVSVGLGGMAPAGKDGAD